MRAWGTMAGLALLLAAAAAAAAEPRVGKFVKYDAGEFVIVTSRSSSQARRAIEDLGKFRATLELTLGRRAAKAPFPTTIVITSSSDWSAWLQPRRNITGFFQRARFANYLAMNGDAPREEALHVVFHEYTHYYLASQFAGEYPPWFNEGLAELMGYAKFDNGLAILRVPLELVHEARDGAWIPFDRLIRVDQNDPEYQSHKLAPSFYAQAWLTVHYGMVENRDFGKQMLEYLNRLNTLVAQEDAARSAFGSDLSVPDRLLREYSHTRQLGSGGINLGDVPPVTLPAGQPIDELETVAILADVMLETRLAPDRIRPLVESLGRRDQNGARASILAARLALADDDGAAFDRAVTRAERALMANDWLQRRELASVLLSSGMESSPLTTRKSEDMERDVKRSLKWFAEAVQMNSADVEALWGLGTAATHLDSNLDIAEQALLVAYQHAPASAQIAVSLANLKSRQDKPDEMIPYLKDAVRYATDLGTRRWAAATLVEIQRFIARRDAVEAENRKQREEYERQLAEYEKKYGKRKKPQ